MDYQKIYNNLILTRSTQAIHQDVYYEDHHIIPKCLGGSNNKQNIIKLTYKEHFIAHWLLTRIYPGNRKIGYAFLCMIRDPHGKRVINSRYYSAAKLYFAKIQKENGLTNNPMWTPEAKKKHSDRMKKSNPQHTHPDKCRRFTESPSKGKVAYNNGAKNMYFEIDKQPEGWVRGLLPYKRKQG